MAAHIDPAFRARLSALGPRYAVGVTGSVTVWPPGREPLAPLAYSGRGRVRPSDCAWALQATAWPQHHPQSLKELALQPGPEHGHTVAWREGTNAKPSSRFARLRVRAAHRDRWRDAWRAPEWRLIEWRLIERPKGDPEPLEYWAVHRARRDAAAAHGV